MTNPPTRIIALDPGKTTGYAIVDWDGTSPTAKLLTTGHITGIAPLGRWLEANLYDHTTVLIYETFRLYAHKAQDLINADMIASQAIGVIKYVADKRSICPVEQSASRAKGIHKNQIIARLDAEGVPRSPHQWDACRHALYYILSEYNRRARA